MGGWDWPDPGVFGLSAGQYMYRWSACRDFMLAKPKTTNTLLSLRNEVR